MEIKHYQSNNFTQFVDYCKAYRKDFDDSNLGDQDLLDYNEQEHFTLLAFEGEELVGALSLMISDYYQKGRKGRFRIFHSIKNAGYKLLFQEFLKTPFSEFDEVYLFIKEIDSLHRQIFKEMDFTIERYSYLLERELHDLEPVHFPDSYTLRPFVNNNDEALWCQIINESFKHLMGHISDLTIEKVKHIRQSKEYLEGGMMLLEHHNQGVGLVSVTEDELDLEPVAYIGPIAILPSEQHKGLGKMMLRAALHFGASKGYRRSYLSVNAENEKAVELYLKTGFIQTEAVVCYRYLLHEVKK